MPNAKNAGALFAWLRAALQRLAASLRPPDEADCALQSIPGHANAAAWLRHQTVDRCAAGCSPLRLRRIVPTAIDIRTRSVKVNST